MTLQFKNVTRTHHPICYYIITISPATKVPALDYCDNTYAHTCGRTVGAQSRQLSCLRLVLLSPFPFGLLMVGQAREATHTTNVTDHHNIHQTASDPANITFTQYFTSLQTTPLCHIIRMDPSNRNILGYHCSAHCTLHTVATTHAQALSRKYSDVRTAAVYDYR